MQHSVPQNHAPMHLPPSFSPPRRVFKPRPQSGFQKPPPRVKTSPASFNPQTFKVPELPFNFKVPNLPSLLPPISSLDIADPEVLAQVPHSKEVLKTLMSDHGVYHPIYDHPDPLLSFDFSSLPRLRQL
ncbi:hypothetical protein RCL1_008626 [Eukaryota sp. TZLM3-RCL]